MSQRGDSSLVQSARSGLTIVELVVVIIIIAILAGLFLPAIQGHGSSHHRNPCANNLKQIVASCIAYSQDQDTSWPIGVSPSCTFPINSPHQARMVANRSFEVLAHIMNLSNKLFYCPSTHLREPRLKPDSGNINGDNWGSSQGNPVPYAYDWACPAEPTLVLIVFADRSYANHSAKGVMAASGRRNAQ
jgi:Tfp pilus assembly protein PilE